MDRRRRSAHTRPRPGSYRRAASINLQSVRRSTRAGRLATSLAAALLVVSLLPVAPVSVALGATVVVRSRRPGGRRHHDLRRQPRAPATRRLTPPSMPEAPGASPNDIAGGTSLVLTAPAGFAWNRPPGRHRRPRRLPDDAVTHRAASLRLDEHDHRSLHAQRPPTRASSRSPASRSYRLPVRRSSLPRPSPGPDLAVTSIERLRNPRLGCGSAKSSRSRSSPARRLPTRHSRLRSNRLSRSPTSSATMWPRPIRSRR